MRLYFAYGSNLCEAQMRERCPQCKKLGVAKLSRFRWIISARGYANVVESNEDFVEGVLYEISRSDEASLDRYEGVSSGSYKKQILSIVYSGATVDALVYVDPTTKEGSPKREYIGRINSGLAAAPLSSEYINHYIRKFIPS